MLVFKVGGGSRSVTSSTMLEAEQIQSPKPSASFNRTVRGEGGGRAVSGFQANSRLAQASSCRLRASQVIGEDNASGKRSGEDGASGNSVTPRRVGRAVATVMTVGPKSPTSGASAVALPRPAPPCPAPSIVAVTRSCSLAHSGWRWLRVVAVWVQYHPQLQPCPLWLAVATVVLRCC